MKFHEMIDEVIDKIRMLDPDHEFRALTAHVAVTSPIALELLAHEHLTSVGHEARRVAAVQLRVVRDFASKLRWLERVCLDEGVEPGVRVGLAGVLHQLSADQLPAIDSEAAVLLEPALLFHVLLSRLRPWLPPMILALEPDPVLELLQLGIPDYLHPILHQRFEDLWQLFHRLREHPPTTPGPGIISDEQLSRLAASRSPNDWRAPSAPAWTTPSWISPWLSEGASSPARLPYLSPSELTG